MPKYVATPLGSSYGSVAAINANLAAIETAFQNTVSRDGSTPNAMGASFDMNGNDILNVNNIQVNTLTIGGGTIQSALDAAVVAATAAAGASAAAASVSEANAHGSATNAATSAVNADASAVAAAASASSASSSASSATNAAALALSYTSFGFGGTLLDLGFVTDATIYFPTDLGVL